MVREENIEKMFDIIDEACCFLFEKKKITYLDSLFIITTDILNNEMTADLDNEDYPKLKSIYDKMESLSLNSEEVRKTMQYLLIRAFKEERLVNQVTPDTIGYLVAYLANKLYAKKKISIFDMCLGTGNLITTVANQMNEPLLYGIDIDPLMTDIAKMNANMQDYDLNVYLGDTLDSHFANMDLIIGDIPDIMTEEKYLPYEAILYHKNSLKDEGYMIVLVPNDFFNHDTGVFKKAFDDGLQMFGLLELPDKMFTGKKKSLLLIQKTNMKKKNFLMVKIPDFDNQELMNNTITKIEQWFKGENYYD